MKNENRIAFNTRREYTANGQRIAAQAIEGGVYMVDVDRGLHYFYPDISLDQESVMWAYDHNKHIGVERDLLGLTYQEEDLLKQELSELAQAL